MGLTLNPPAAVNKAQLRYTLTSSGTLTIPGVSAANPITATVVCVGGGAGGASGCGSTALNSFGGTSFGICAPGGSGGFGGSVVSKQVLISGPVPYVVGAGGAGGVLTTNWATGGAGGDTYFETVYAPGGRTLGHRDDNYLPLSNFSRLWSVDFWTNQATTGATGALNGIASVNSIVGPGYGPDGGWRRNSFNAVDATNNSQPAALHLFAASHGASPTGYQGMSTTGQTARTGMTGTAGGTAGGGTAAVPAAATATVVNQAIAASTSKAPFANMPIMLLHAGGGGGSGGSGRADGAAGNAGGAGGAGTTYGGTGGAGGTGATASGSGVVNGGTGSAATGVGAGGGGGGGAATGNTSNSGSAAGGAGGAGSSGAIYIYF
jgi:hypothetical protein